MIGKVEFPNGTKYKFPLDSAKKCKEGEKDNLNSRQRKLYTTLDNYLDLLEKYSTEDSPDVTPEENFIIRKELTKTVDDKILYPTENDTYIEPFRLLECIDWNSKTYTDEFSDGGKNITVDEMYEISEILLNWTGFRKTEEQ